MAVPKSRGGVGFRDFEVFNQALVAKQGWRIIQNPLSLCSRILKAKYFPDNDFMEARLGRSPSYTWRSILYGRDALEHGLIWRIGDGEAVNAWTDRWIPKNDGGRTTTQPHQRVECKVSHFIEPNSRSWRKDVIEQTFCTQDAAAISEIPISKISRNDFRAWRLEHTGMFSVRSLYKFLMEQSQPADGGQLGLLQKEDAGALWKAIWNLKAPSKIQVFLWRLSHRIIPVCGQLSKRGVEVEARCSRCRVDEEDCLHALWCCPKAKIVWEGVSGRYNTIFCDPNNDDVASWLHSNLVGTDDQRRMLFAVTTWALWNERNNTVVAGKEPRPVESQVEGIAHLADEYDQIAHDVRPAVDYTSREEERWQCPREGWVKVNTDAGIRRGAGVIGLGVLVRNHLGGWLTGCAKRMEGEFEVLTAEAHALREGVQLARQAGFQNVAAEVDSQLLTKLMKSRDSDFSAIGAIIRDIRDICNTFCNFTLSFVHREANRAAHECANFSLSVLEDVYWNDHVPSFVVPYLNLQDHRPDE